MLVRQGLLTAGLAALAMAAVPVTASAAPKVKLKVSEQRNGPYVRAPGPNPLDVSTNGENPKNLYLRASLADDRVHEGSAVRAVGQ